MLGSGSPLISIYLFFRSREGFLKFSLIFFLVNILGFIIYYVYPAAPPLNIRLFGGLLQKNLLNYIFMKKEVMDLACTNKIFQQTHG